MSEVHVQMLIWEKYNIIHTCQVQCYWNVSMLYNYTAIDIFAMDIIYGGGGGGGGEEGLNIF